MEEKKFYNRFGDEIKRQACNIYTRVMGYMTNVGNYNIGKKSEFYSRKCFTEQAAANSKFKRDFTSKVNDESTKQ